MFSRPTRMSFLPAIGKLFFLALMVALPTLAAPLASAAETPKKVLIFSGVDPNISSVIEVSEIFRSTLEKGSPARFQFYSESLDNLRIPEDKYEQELVKLLQRKYQGEKFDLIFTITSPALKFLLKHQDELFPDTPTIFFHTSERDHEDFEPGTNVTGVQGGVELKSALDLALSLHPGTRRVVVVPGTGPRGRFWESLARKEFQSYGTSLEFTYPPNLTIEALRKDLGSLPQGTVVLFLSVLADSAGNSYSLPDSVSLVAPSSSAPIYVVNQSAFRPGVVGGRMISYEALAKAAAELGLRVLGGEKPQDIPPQSVSSVAMFDWRELRRWGIDENKLPGGSIVLYREFSVWELYKWRIIGVASLFILEALLIIWLLVNRSRRRQVEKDNERLAQLAEAGRRRLDEVVSNVPGIVWEVRAEPGTNFRKATFVSEYVEKLLGYSVHEWLSTPGFAMKIIPEEDRERSVQQAQALFESGKGGVLQFRWVTKDGRIIWVESQYAPICDEAGIPIGMRGVTMDITDRMLAEEALRESEHRFQLVSQTTKDILYEWNLQTDFVWWNDSAMRSVFGYPLEEMRHDVNWWEERLHPEDKDRIDVSVDEALRGVEQMWENEYRFRKVDNSYAHVYHRAFIVRGEGGQALKVIGSLMDFTERKQSEEKLRSALEEVNKLKNHLEAENLYLQEEIKSTLNVAEIVGRSNAIKYVLFKIEQVSKTDSTVMILGETGTGKELVARAIHSQSLRKDRPLVRVNCAALSAGLIESELFGHEKGSFTGASTRKIGRFELADGATLFLDEIGELPLDLQSKLLRVIQEGEFERLGSSKTIKADVRIIAATNRNMKSEVEQGAFREDLWYRLNVFPITVPPLTQRKEDIPPMVEHFVSSFSRKVGKNITAVSSATLKKLQDYSWPGNVRELANVIERGVINAQGPVLHITDQFEQITSSQPTGTSRTLDEIEKEYITRILGDTAWKIEGPNGAAKILGLNPSTLRTRMVKLGILKGAHNSAKG